jgi:hypothetical protein
MFDLGRIIATPGGNIRLKDLIPPTPAKFTNRRPAKKMLKGM